MIAELFVGNVRPQYIAIRMIELCVQDWHRHDRSGWCIYIIKCTRSRHSYGNRTYSRTARTPTPVSHHGCKHESRCHGWRPGHVQQWRCSLGASHNYRRMSSSVSQSYFSVTNIIPVETRVPSEPLRIESHRLIEPKSVPPGSRSATAATQSSTQGLTPQAKPLVKTAFTKHHPLGAETPQPRRCRRYRE